MRSGSAGKNLLAEPPLQDLVEVVPMSDAPDGDYPLGLVDGIRSPIGPDPQPENASQVACQALRALRSRLFSQGLNSRNGPAPHLHGQVCQVALGGFVELDLVTHRPNLSLASESGTFLPPAAMRSRVT